jgi:hypothetical protein
MGKQIHQSKVEGLQVDRSCRASLRPLFVSAASLLTWLPPTSALPAGVTSWGTLFVSTNFLLCNFLATLSAANTAARRPAGLQRAAASADGAAAPGLAEVLSVAAPLLPALRQVLLEMHAAFGKLLEGELVSESADEVWAVFAEGDEVRLGHSTRCHTVPISISKSISMLHAMLVDKLWLWACVASG